jgi:hypothetical protein
MAYPGTECSKATVAVTAFRTAFVVQPAYPFISLSPRLITALCKLRAIKDAHSIRRCLDMALVPLPLYITSLIT